MERQPLKLDVVSADRMVWQGDVVNVIARTSEGDIGILPGHEPLMAALTPCMVEIVSADGTTGILAIDGGLLAVAHGHIRILRFTDCTSSMRRSGRGRGTSRIADDQ